MIDIQEIVRQLASSAATIRALVQGVSDAQAAWSPHPESWSVNQVMQHVYNEERLDFRKHLQEMLSDPQQPWTRLSPDELLSVGDRRQALDLFLRERDASLAWLEALRSPDWDRASEIRFGPNREAITLSAGDVLVSWVDHDLAHIRQMVKLLHAWLVDQAAPYSVQYGGGRWSEGS